MIDFKAAMEEATEIIQDTDWEFAPCSPEDVLIDTFRLHLREYLVAAKNDYESRNNTISAMTVDRMLQDLSKA